jgi:hypothetical protein
MNLREHCEFLEYRRPGITTIVNRLRVRYPEWDDEDILLRAKMEWVSEQMRKDSK